MLSSHPFHTQYTRNSGTNRVLLRRILADMQRNTVRGIAVAQWLRCCATNRKVAGSIPDGVIGIFH